MKKWMWEKEWNKKAVQVTAAFTAVTLAAGCAGAGRMGGSSSGNASESMQAEIGEGKAGPYVTSAQRNRLGLSDADLRNLSKDETVYVISGADGGVQKIIVSDWIKNSMGSSQIQDLTELSDISNVKGMETFEAKGNGTGVWDAGGNDIYYQGSIEKDLPVDMKVSYTLDGKSISPEELAGKSGHVVMHFSYTNRQKQTVMVGDEQRELYVPFAVVTSMMLDNEKFSNVEVSSGKIINDGEHLMVIGCAMPGMQENLDMKKEDLDIPDYVEISGDVTDFSLETTMTVVTNEIFNDMDLENVDSLDELSDSLDDLDEGMHELMDGAGELYDGITELRQKSGDLTDGIAELGDGAHDLNSGAVELRNGAQELRDGAAALDQGLKTLESNNETLNGGAKQVFETLLATAETQLKAAGVPLTTKLTIENYGTVLDEMGAKMTPEQVKALAEQAALAKVTEAVEQNRPAVEAGVVQAMKAAIRQKIEAQLAAGGTVIAGQEKEIQDSPAEETKADLQDGAQEGTTGTDGSGSSSGAGEAGTGTAESEPEADTNGKESNPGGEPAGSDETENQPEAGNGVEEETAGSKGAESPVSETQNAPAAEDGAAVRDEMTTEDGEAVRDEMTTEDGEAVRDEMTAEDEVAALGGSIRVFREISSGQNAVVKERSWTALAASPDLEAKINAMVEAQFQTPEVQAQYQAAVQAKMEELIQQNMQSPEVQQQIDAAVQAAINGAGSLTQLKNSLDSYNQFYQGLLAYTAGVASASSGSGQLTEGSQKLYDGTKELAEGTGKLKDGTHELRDGGDKLIHGIQQLWEGGQELADGVNKFNEEGIQKLVETFDDDVQGLADRLRAIQDVSRKYRSFAGISDDMEGSVKFVYKTEGIGVE